MHSSVTSAMLDRGDRGTAEAMDLPEGNSWIDIL